MGLQAALLTSAALTAEVNALKQSLERSENELGRAKKQLEDKEGEEHLIKVVPNRKGFGCKRMKRITWVFQGLRTRWQP